MFDRQTLVAGGAGSKTEPIIVLGERAKKSQKESPEYGLLLFDPLFPPHLLSGEPDSDGFSARCS